MPALEWFLMYGVAALTGLFSAAFLWALHRWVVDFDSGEVRDNMLARGIIGLWRRVTSSSP